MHTYPSSDERLQQNEAGSDLPDIPRQIPKGWLVLELYNFQFFNHKSSTYADLFIGSKYIGVQWKLIKIVIHWSFPWIYIIYAEIWNRFNPQKPLIFPTLTLLFFVTTPIPFSLLTPLNLGLKWVQPMYHFDRLHDYTLVCPIFNM